MKVHINVIDGKIVLTFDQSYSWLALTAEEARNLANTLLEMATRLEAPKDAAGDRDARGD